MTNTRITDPEVLEHRFPVRLEEFKIREGSGGKGFWRGGDGVVRAFRFLDTVHVGLLTSRRRQGPFGLAGGEAGAPGVNELHRPGHAVQDLGANFVGKIERDSMVVIKTPGGGGYG